MISDIRVRAGQEVAAGDQVANIVDEDAGYELIALLPGSFAPQLRSGMSVTLKLQGYPDSRETIPVDRVGGEIVGPREAARYLGKESAESLPVSGSIVIVRSTLRHAEFVAGGRALPYHDGMTGEAAVTLRSEPMIVSLIPGLRALLANR
jgi:membrane fusion protein (multidrug efflux system)